MPDFQTTTITTTTRFSTQVTWPSEKELRAERNVPVKFRLFSRQGVWLLNGTATMKLSRDPARVGFLMERTRGEGYVAGAVLGVPPAQTNGSQGGCSPCLAA